MARLADLAQRRMLDELNQAQMYSMRQPDTQLSSLLDSGADNFILNNQTGNVRYLSTPQRPQMEVSQPRRPLSLEDRLSQNRMMQALATSVNNPAYRAKQAQDFLRLNPQYANEPGFSQEELSADDGMGAGMVGALQARGADIERQMAAAPKAMSASDQLAREKFEWEKSGGKTQQKAPAGYRYTPDGALEAIPGGPADLKSQAKTAGREGVDSQIATLQNYYNRLNELDAIPSTKKDMFTNIGARVSASGIGQVAGGAIGSEAQSMRDSINMQRPLLLQAIKEATGMSAQQMNSNAEMQMFLKAATDPTLGYEANTRALNKLSELYGLGKGDATTTGSADADAVAWAKANPNDPRSAKILSLHGM